ncbi:MAG: hypothetical protein NC483_02155 [Ruminococcus sp.]|nr:hypothetical protein [Ruminococcus sp.]
MKIKSNKKRQAEIEQAKITLENVLANAEEHYNKVQGLLFTNANLSSNKLLELEQILNMSGAIASSRLDILKKKINEYIRNNVIKVNTAMVIGLLSMLLSLIYPPAVFLCISSFILLVNPKNLIYTRDITSKSMTFSYKIKELMERYTNYSEVIFSRINKKDEEEITKDTAHMLLNSINPELIINAINFINLLIDEEITLNDIPEELIYPITLILARDLDVEVSNLPELISLAKEKFHKNIQERELHI